MTLGPREHLCGGEIGMIITFDIERDSDSGVTTVSMDGKLTFVAAPVVQAVLAVLATSSKHAAEQWGVPIPVCRARPHIARWFGSQRLTAPLRHQPSLRTWPALTVSAPGYWRGGGRTDKGPGTMQSCPRPVGGDRLFVTVPNPEA